MYINRSPLSVVDNTIDNGHLDLEVLDDEKQVTESQVYVAEEKLQFKRINGEKGNRFNSIIEYRYDNENEAIFGLEVRYKEFTGNDKSLLTNYTI